MKPQSSIPGPHCNLQPAEILYGGNVKLRSCDVAIARWRDDRISQTTELAMAEGDDYNMRFCDFMLIANGNFAMGNF